MAVDPYSYPGSDNVLINKQDIKDKRLLNEFERDVTAIRIAEIQTIPLKGDFDLKHLQAIHREIFQDVYPWAGEIRTVDIAKSNLFCRAMFIPNMAGDIFKKIQRDSFLIGMEKDTAIRKLAEYIGDINALHPFREGNGRTQRIFINYLANAAGLELNFSKTSREKMMEASLKSFGCDYYAFEEMFQEIATPITAGQQRELLKNISPKAYKILESIHRSNEAKTLDQWKQEISNARSSADAKMEKQSNKKISKAERKND